MSVPPDKVREALGRPDQQGSTVFDWNLTHSNILDPVRLVIPPNNVLPVIFVPGIMGSNLKQRQGNGGIVWRLDEGLFGLPTSLMKQWLGKEPGLKQRLLHPNRVEVDSKGATPSKRFGSVYDTKEYERRGWGEVGEGSYHSFLIWLEDTLNGQTLNPALWREFYYTAFSEAPVSGRPAPRPKLHPGISMQMRDFKPEIHLDRQGVGSTAVESVTSDDLLKRAKFRMPVYACGYNWLASNDVAGGELAKRIKAVIAENNLHGGKCEQVLLVTHSMGGLVARHCQTLPGMASMIAGVVHGVMPTTGAAVAYRRCKVGMWDEDFGASLVIGTTGQQVTAVFAQAPGALQLLPTEQYRKPWLSIRDASGGMIEAQPTGNPYEDIYLRPDRWWGLVREEWLSPVRGIAIEWKDFQMNAKWARDFHRQLAGKFHPHTYVFYGASGKASEQASFETVQWRMQAGRRPDYEPAPTGEEVSDMGFKDVRDDGSNPVHVGGRIEVPMTFRGDRSPMPYQTSYWELHCGEQDGGGDGTVPISSGAAPMTLVNSGQVKQQFRLQGFSHEEAFRNTDAQQTTLHAVMKIAGTAREPA